MQSALTDFFERQADIRLAILFGSAASDRLQADSDVDVAVLAEQPLNAARKAELMSALALITGRPIDLIDLKTTGQPLLGQILQGRQLKGSTDLLAQLAYRNVIERSDFLPLIERSLAQRRRAWIQA
ncbi:MAG: nucleotidyltransferase domain-containing protein [Burkholderiales bacterium]|nr:MAG: nucleotidyltransferase domain-containing protein [Burkholderiales bacterium]